MIAWYYAVPGGIILLILGFFAGAFVASAGHAGNMYDAIARNHFNDELRKKREEK